MCNAESNSISSRRIVEKCKRRDIPSLVCLVGLDGTGKSALARRIQDELERKGYRTRYVWMRMNYFLTRPVLLYCRLTGLTRRPVVDGQKISVHDFYKSKFIAKLVQILHTADTIIAYFLKVWIPMKFSNRIVICDRFFHDVLVDFVVESRDFNLPHSRIARVLFRLTPKNSRIFLLKVHKDKIVQRKPEVLHYDENFHLRYKLYDSLNEYVPLEVIWNNGPISEGFQSLVRKLRIDLWQ